MSSGGGGGGGGGGGDRGPDAPTIAPVDFNGNTFKPLADGHYDGAILRFLF